MKSFNLRQSRRSVNVSRQSLFQFCARPNNSFLKFGHSDPRACFAGWKPFNFSPYKAFEGNWFNQTHNLDISESDLIYLLNIATKDQLFQFNGKPHEQTDGVTMGSPLGP